MIEVVEPSYYWFPNSVQQLLRTTLHLERCGRVCYKSEDRITDDSAERFITTICANSHESVLEHTSLTMGIICSRACSHQIVRHRLGSYSQESQRYVNYNKRKLFQVICPPSIGLDPGVYTPQEFKLVGIGCMTKEQADWLEIIHACCKAYSNALLDGARPEDARYVLPNAMKTELAVTYNLRQWRHVFRERALNKRAQWEIRDIFSGILREFQTDLPSVFGDLVVE